MAEGQKKGLIRVTLLMTLIGITVVLVLAPASKVENALLQERFYIAKTTGEFSEYQQWTQAVHLASPVIQMCGGEDGAGEAVVLEKLKAPLYNQQKMGTWIAKRGETCQAVAKAVTYRLVGSFMWAPLLLPLLHGMSSRLPISTDVALIATTKLVRPATTTRRTRVLTSSAEESHLAEHFVTCFLKSGGICEKYHQRYWFLRSVYFHDNAAQGKRNSSTKKCCLSGVFDRLHNTQ